LDDVTEAIANAGLTGSSDCFIDDLEELIEYYQEKLDEADEDDE